MNLWLYFISRLTSKTSLVLLTERLFIRVGKVLKLSNMVLIKVVTHCIRMGIKFVRQKSDFHAYDFLGLEVAS